mmetsp:Transcript_113653/g.253632  ORF Transcript_113653/g.253632 Transcript_113653/m.253632 type:complete len:364 (+) Transcript_113653:2-1093(+)
MAAVTNESLVVVCVSITTGLFEQLHVAEIRATFRAKYSRNSETMSERLFSGICDVTVHLDHSLTIMRPTPQLEGYLLQAPRPQAMQGKWFPSLFRDELDRDAFIAMVTRPPGSFANTMNVRFMDAMGTIVQARLFHTSGLNLEDETIHSVGIVGPQEKERSGLQALVPGEASETVQCILETTIGRVQEDADADGDGASSIGSSTTLPMDTETCPNRVAVWIDADSADLRCLRHTPDFALFCGLAPPADMSLLKLVRAGADSLERALQNFVNEVVHGVGHAGGGCEVLMKPCGRMSSIKGYRARVDFASEAPNAGSGANEGRPVNEDGHVLRLTFSNIKTVRRSVYDMPRATHRARKRGHMAAL